MASVQNQFLPVCWTFDMAHWCTKNESRVVIANHFHDYISFWTMLESISHESLIPKRKL